MKDPSLPLNLTHVHKTSMVIHRVHTLLQSIALAALIYYRASFLYQIITSRSRDTPILPWLLVSAAELALSIGWLMNRAFRWRPVSRTVFPERLPGDEHLPGVDVFICTVDPSKEPTVAVMNTVLSTMAMDYPVEKLSVYLSDDGGSPVTLSAMRETYKFAKWWLPFCRTYGVKTRCPEAYFSAKDDESGDLSNSAEFSAEKKKIKDRYLEFTDELTRIRESADFLGFSRNHPATVEVISDEYISTKQAEVPMLVYVSREKRPSHSHNFKAGALNALLRVSTAISNAPFVLVLDCDMYCNDSTSTRQAMCFHLDPKLSPSLAFVLFPQRMHNVAESDLYDSHLRLAFWTLWPGLDGLDGPILTGTNFYMKKEALNVPRGQKDGLIKSLHENGEGLSGELLQEAKHLASCGYENGTDWGKQVGFLYHSVVEDFFTGFILHSKGWKSVYCHPSRASFLGTGTTTLNDALGQGARWSSGLIEIFLSRYCPLIYGVSKKSFLQTLCYADHSSKPLYCLPVLCLATIPQLCLLYNIPLYPEVSNSFFSGIFAIVVISYHLKHLEEYLTTTKTSIRTWINEHRICSMKAVTGDFYGTVDAIMKKFGIREASFSNTNKAIDEEQLERYQNGIYDFQTSNHILYPLVTLFILSFASLIGGVARMILTGDYNTMPLQIFVSFYIVALHYPTFDGMFLRKDKGSIPLSVTLMSSLFSIIFFSLGYVFLMY